MLGRPFLCSVEQNNMILPHKQNARRANTNKVSFLSFSIGLFVFRNTCKYFSWFHQTKKVALTTITKPSEELITLLGPNLRSSGHTNRASRKSRLSDEAAVSNVFNRVFAAM